MITNKLIGGSLITDKNGEKYIILSDSSLISNEDAYSYASIKKITQLVFHKTKKEIESGEFFILENPTNEDYKNSFKVLELQKNKINDLRYKLRENCNHKMIEDNYERAVCQKCDLSLNWYCNKSPDKVCHYYSHDGKVELINGKYAKTPKNHNKSFETSDSCIFCNNPQERR